MKVQRNEQSIRKPRFITEGKPHKLSSDNRIHYNTLMYIIYIAAMFLFVDKSFRSPFHLPKVTIPYAGVGSGAVYKNNALARISALQKL